MYRTELFIVVGILLVIFLAIIAPQFVDITLGTMMLQALMEFIFDHVPVWYVSWSACGILVSALFIVVLGMIIDQDTQRSSR